jgi:hypothetical protein
VAGFKPPLIVFNFELIILNFEFSEGVDIYWLLVCDYPVIDYEIYKAQIYKELKFHEG